MKIKSHLFFMTASGIIAFALLAGGCNKQSAKIKPLDAANMDTAISASDDFYQFANGVWIKNNPIPAQYSRYGVFEALEEENHDQLKAIFDKVAKDKNATDGSVAQKIRDFYNAGMDTVTIEKAGIEPLQADLAAIEAIKTPEDVAKVITAQHLSGNYPAFYFMAAPDDKNSNQMIGLFYQGGLSLPDRDYYLENDARSKEIRDAFVKHVAKMLGMAGTSAEQAVNDAQTVLHFETQLAKISSTRLELRDPQANYHKMDLAGLKSIAPGFNWDEYFKTLGVTATNELNVSQVNFISGMAKLLKTAPIKNWKTYLRWDAINSAAPALSSNFDKEHFAFYGTVLTGKTEQQPRWKRIIDQTSNSLGEAVGQLYVKEYFPPQAKERMQKLVENLRAALGARIDKLAWMSDSTKKEAHAKLEKIKVKIGYPDKWIDYSNLKVAADSYYANYKNARQFEANRVRAKIGKPVDRSDWDMTPQTVNAYYSPNMNEIVFPAAILQPPFFFMDADDAVNYGAIGMVISHEMTHGFDDQGRQFDKDGNLKDWWTKEDAERFEKQTATLVEQYDNYKMLDSLHVDGKLTLGENIADLGGMNIAYDGLQKALEGKDANAKIDGFTPAQRFFLSYAQIWRGNTRDKEIMRRLKVDVHSPGEARVNQIVYNIPAFYEAFNIKPAGKRYIAPEKRAAIW